MINKINPITVKVSVTKVIKLSDNSVLDFQAYFCYEYFDLCKKLFSSKSLLNKLVLYFQAIYKIFVHMCSLEMSPKCLIQLNVI